MHNSADSTAPGRIPAWRRLGIKLDSETPGTEAYRRIQERKSSRSSNKVGFSNIQSSGRSDSNLTVVSEAPSSPKDEEVRKRKSGALFAENQSTRVSSSNDSTPVAKRKKSVTFSPETKVNDDDVDDHLLEQWATKQNGGHDEFSKNEASKFLQAAKPKSRDINVSQASTAAKHPQKPKSKKAEANTLPERAADESTAGERPSYLDYVVQYHNDRRSWKFNKIQQSKLLKNIFNMSRIPEEYDDALLPYLSGLQGEGMRTRLKEEATSILKASSDNDAADENKEDGDENRRRQQGRASLVLLALSSSDTRPTDSGGSASVSQDQRIDEPRDQIVEHIDSKAKRKRSRKGRISLVDD